MDQTSESQVMNSSSRSPQAKEPQKSCTDCRTTRTPLWRGGPAGPRVYLLSLTSLLHVLYVCVSFLIMQDLFLTSC